MQKNNNNNKDDNNEDDNDEDGDEDDVRFDCAHWKHWMQCKGK